MNGNLPLFAQRPAATEQSATIQLSKDNQQPESSSDILHRYGFRNAPFICLLQGAEKPRRYFLIETKEGFFEEYEDDGSRTSSRRSREEIRAGIGKGNIEEVSV